MPMIFDTHAHYDDACFEEDRDDVIQNLKIQGVGRVVNIAADSLSVETTYKLAHQYEMVYGALGIHPSETKEITEKNLERIRELVSEDRKLLHPKIVALGEMGLDYHEEEVSKETQINWFEKQLALAKKLDLPVVVHSRDAAQDTYEVLKHHLVAEGAGIIHCFSYSKEMAKSFLDLGYYIALGGVVTFKNGRVAKEVVSYLPKDRLLLETDSPYIAPEPLRGSRNNSGNLRYVVEKMAELRNTTPEDIMETTWENANRLYRIKE